jgi:hypothetical protein
MSACQNAAAFTLDVTVSCEEFTFIDIVDCFVQWLHRIGRVVLTSIALGCSRLTVVFAAL